MSRLFSVQMVPLFSLPMRRRRLLPPILPNSLSMNLGGANFCKQKELSSLSVSFFAKNVFRPLISLLDVLFGPLFCRWNVHSIMSLVGSRSFQSPPVSPDRDLLAQCRLSVRPLPAEDLRLRSFLKKFFVGALSLPWIFFFRLAFHARSGCALYCDGYRPTVPLFVCPPSLGLSIKSVPRMCSMFHRFLPPVRFSPHSSSIRACR